MRKSARDIALSTALAVLLLTASCRKSATPSGNFWDTGCRVTDSLLCLIDSLENPESYGRDVNDVDYARLASLYGAVDSLHRNGATPIDRALSLYARAAVAEESELDDARAYTLDSMAAAGLDSASAPYLFARVNFDKARLSPDIKQETERLYSSVAYFHSIGDSIYLTEALYELQNAYADIWDYATTVRCYRDIIRFSTSANSQLRSYMRFNILLNDRASRPEIYRRSLDSISSDKAFFDNAPVIGVTVYTDLFRFSGHAAYLDSAAKYLPRLRFYHDCIRLYASQRLAHAMAVDEPRDTLDKYAAMLIPGLDEPGTIEIETLPVLRDYCFRTGQITETRRADSVHAALRLRCEAYKEAAHMTRMNMEGRLDSALADSRSSGPSLAGWLIAAALTAVIATAIYLLALHIRRRRREENMKQELEKARRKAVVSHLHEVERAGGEEDWQRFEAVFVEMHPDFPGRLKEVCPELTKGDIRMCAMLRMGLDTKHIARILSIHPESVKKHRQRLRAKFGLSPDVDWQEFLSRF